MQLTLTPHADFPCAALDTIEVTVTRQADTALSLVYRATGRIAHVVLSGPAAPLRTDGLWRVTCFEAFVKRKEDEEYFELNFAPSSAWAAYRFSHYREGMSSLEIGVPRIDPRYSDDAFELEVFLDLAGLAPLGPCRLGLSAVIEERSGAKSYWALAHPDVRPDFHNDAGFVAGLP